MGHITHLSISGFNMKNNRIKNIIFIFSFLSLTTLPIFQAEIKLLPELKLKEKRELYKRPEELINFNSMKDLKSSLRFLSIYMDDQFGFRNYYIYLYNWINVKLFQSSPRESVILGKDEWLFYDRINSEKTEEKELKQLSQNLSKKEIQVLKENKISFSEYNIPDYLGLVPYSENELELIKENIENLETLLKKKNIQLYLFFVPNKHTIYPEYLPNWILSFKKKKSKMEQVMNYMKVNSNFKITDSLEYLLKEKTNKLYLKHDTHFNNYGSYVFYQLIHRDLNKNHNLTLPEFEVREEVTSSGDLIDMLGLLQDFTETVPVIAPKSNKAKQCDKDKEIDMIDRITTISQSCFYTDNRSLPKILIYGDSFGEPLAVLLKEDSQQLYFFLTIKFSIDVKFINSTQPNIVILEVAERGIEKLKTLDIKL